MTSLFTSLIGLITFQTPDETASGAGEAVAEEVEKGKELFQQLKGLSIDDAISKIANSLVDFAFKLLIAILVFYIGRFIIKKIYGFIRTVMVNRKMDASLTTFVLSLVNMLLYFILIITIISILGIETSSFLALFASAGVAIGMAMSGTLQNFAGGVLILILKPYKVGDYIEAQGYTGTVKAIQIFHTVINTVDNKAIIIPNGGLSTSSINNYSLEQYRRVDWTIALAYGTDFKAAQDAMLEILLSDTRVVKKYIEDDRAERIRMHLDQAEEERVAEEERLDAEAKASSWWKRLRLRRRRRRLEAKEEPGAHSGIASGAVEIHSNIDRSPFVGLGELADSSVNFTVRAWTHSSNYWDLFFEMNRRFYTELPTRGFSFPFPQLDVHLNPSES